MLLSFALEVDDQPRLLSLTLPSKVSGKKVSESEKNPAKQKGGGNAYQTLGSRFPHNENRTLHLDRAPHA